VIGKISIGKGFAGCLSYCLKNKDKSKETPPRAAVLYYNQCFGNVHQLIRQFNDVRRLNNRINKPVWHSSFSFIVEDKLTSQDKIDIAISFASKFDFSDNQFIVIEHNDTPNHPHFHIITNRVGFDGKTVTDSNNYKRLAEFCRSIEKEYNLTCVQSPDKFLPPNERRHHRNDTRKENMKSYINLALSNSISLPQFIQKINENGCQVEVGRGIAFIDEKKVRVKGSEIGFSLDNIKKQLAKNINDQLSLTKNRDRSINLEL